MYRYRYFGNSFNVVARAKKHIHKLGKILSIRGYRYIGRYGATWEAVLIKGETGSARFHGVCWGYGGTGPHALRDLLVFLGVEDRIAETLAFRSRREDRIGTDWSFRWLHNEANTVQYDYGPSAAA